MRKRLLGVLCVYLAVSFFIGGAVKFYSGETFFGPPYSVKFQEWGYPSWFRFVVGAGEVVAAVLMVFPRLRFLAAGMLTVILTGATITHIAIQDVLSHSVSAPLHLVLSLIVLWAYRADVMRAFRSERVQRLVPRRPVAE